MVGKRFFLAVALALSLILVSVYGCTGISQEEQLGTTTLQVQSRTIGAG